MKQLAFGWISLLLLAGCGQESSTTYEVPKAQSDPPAAQPMGATAAENEAVMQAHAAMSAHMPETGFAADLPDGWTQKPAAGMRKASYAIEGTSIDFYLISLSMGDVSSNVNRWRGQVGLAPATAEAIAQEVQTFDVDGHAISYIEIYNEKGGKGIIAAIVDLSPQYWYFTAKGSSDELKAHAAQIRAFLESMEIN